MQIITLTVIWDQSSSVITFTTHPGPGKQNKQITRCEIGLQLLVTASWQVSSPDISWWPQVRWPHTRVLGYLGTLMWWPRKFIVVIKMGKLVADQPSQTWLQSGASLGSGIQEVVSNKSGDHSHNIRYQHQLTLTRSEYNWLPCLLSK